MTHIFQERAGGVTAVHELPRQDVRQRDIINHAISVQKTSNTVAALEYLKSYGVAPQLIERVLLEPARRRSMALP